MAIIELTNVCKRFPGVNALSNVTLSIEAGSCHALMGENGAGKSTLGKILAGIYTMDEGEMLLDGAPVHFHGPLDAIRAGIGMVHQELLFCENLSVAENLSLGNLPSKGLLLDRQKMVERATEWLAKIEAQIDPNINLGSLPISKQQLVQIAGAVGQGARVLIFDEPTSSLSLAETEKLLALIKSLKAQGVTCIYVSHRLEEIFAICDTVTVLRDGQHVGTVPTADIDRNGLVKMMIGRELAADLQVEPTAAYGEELLRVDGLCSAGKFHDISFTVRSGEIVGLGGLVGAGRTEIAESLFGLNPADSGRVFLTNNEVYIHSPSDAMRKGLGLVPEDRKRHGLVLLMTAKENISLPLLRRLASFGWVKSRAERSLAQEYFEKLSVKAPNIDSGSSGLSGGNQQKLVIAKWLASKCNVLIVDEPTRGVDVGAKAEIHGLLRDLAKQGKAVLVISSDLPELIALSHRIVVLREGRQVAEINHIEATEESLMRHMAGVQPTA